MASSERADRIWDLAWEWVIREHEQTLDARMRRELAAWLKADEAHLNAYEEAHDIWLASALVPRPEPIEPMPDDVTDADEDGKHDS